MHRFLRSIGFSHINTRQDIDKLLGIIMNEPDQTKSLYQRIIYIQNLPKNLPATPALLSVENMMRKVFFILNIIFLI